MIQADEPGRKTFPRERFPLSRVDPSGCVLRTNIAVLFVGDEAEKQALLLGEPALFFTTPAYDGSPLVMVRLERLDQVRLTELVTDAWRMRAGG